MHLSWSLSRESHALSYQLSPAMNPQHPHPPLGTLLANSWNWLSCPIPVTVPMSHYDTRTATSTPVTSSSKSSLESTSFEVELRIGLRRAAVDAIPGESTVPKASSRDAYPNWPLRSIENDIRASCGELIFDCVIIGNGRIRPTLFVEASERCPMDFEKLKEEILERMQGFNHRYYVHERVTSTKHVVVVEHGTLPRTPLKRDIRRQAVEGQYKELLDGIYATG